MNALDQAFIKAFAKDRTPPASAERQAIAFHAQPQPPADDVESVSLVLHDMYQHGKRLRIDRPMSADVGLAAHMTMPMVEHVESYELEDVHQAAQPPVVFEDRLTPLDQIAAELERLLDPRGDHRVTPQQEAELATPTTESEESVLEASVKKRTEAVVDREVPTLDVAADQPEVEPQPSAAEPQVSAEDELLAQCLPQVLLAATQCDAPELMTMELMTMELDQQTAPSLDAVSSAIEISVPPLDLEAVETQLHQLQSDAASPCGEEAVEIIDSEPEPEPEPKTPTAIDEPIEALTGPSEGLAEWAMDAEVPAMSPRLDTEVSSYAGDLPEPDAALAEEPAVPAATPFTPAWEVDGFRWPEVCQQLDERTDGRLTDSGGELFAATQDGLKVLAVTSSDRLEGRTTLALSLARTAALAGSRVALVDADAANPELARRLGMEAPCDWCEVVMQGEPLSEAAVASLRDGVTLFPRTFPTDDEVGALNQRLLNTLSELSQYFDLVIVDLPPVSSSEALAEDVVTPCPVDMAVVVRNMQTTPQQQCLDTVATLRQLGVRAVGVIENFTHPEAIMRPDNIV